MWNSGYPVSLSAEARCSTDALFIPETLCQADPSVCPSGTVCDSVTSWCCPPMIGKKSVRIMQTGILGFSWKTKYIIMLILNSS